MDLSTSPAGDLHYGDQPPVLIAATSEAAAARAQRTIGATGLRVAASLNFEDAKGRLQHQVATSAVWVEIDDDRGVVMDELLRQVARDVDEGRYAAVVASTGGLIDPVTFSLGHSSVETIVDADEATRLASFAVATSQAGLPLRLSDVAADRNAERLRQLSDEVGRIAATLARLSTGPGSSASSPMVDPAHEQDLAPVTVETIRSIIRARRLRARYFSEELFADPAWDMLLDLLQAEIAHLRVPVSSLCIAAAVPATTALRWLKTLVSEGIFIRRADPHDGRRVFVELAPQTSQSLRRYFSEIGQVAVI